MGLDTIELVMQIEEEFSIEIPDDVASEILTIGELAQYLEKRTVGAPSEIKYDQACERIFEILIHDFKVNPKIVTANSRFVKDLGLD